ncbi:glycine betaine ABC transporter substrate-binding protein [Tenacibaculum ovolyticum]|uniref:glycine betaine ABC transporter substrate-binding protein n=1 Tax=Tenacibaculum ovolyticum TaxID=104270 RepID=UPI001F1B3E06|nr:glycine betaine ABC transporter substrate-binding protein [Tenacibaculum ovolyticum]
MKSNKKITLGVTNLSFHRIAASLVTNTLVKMGFNVKRSYAPHQENFERLNTGEITMLASAWLPSSHGIYKSNVEKEVPLLELGLHYKPYALWGVPDYVSEEEVSEIIDLLKPSVISKMNKNIQGINSGAGITRFSIQMMKDYKLNHAGYRFHIGTEENCFSTFENAVANKEWIVVPLWKPQFLHYRHNIRKLKEPKELLGTVDKAVLLLRKDKENLFTKAQLEELDSLQFTNDIIAELDYKVSREGKNIDEVTKKWLNNRN